MLAGCATDENACHTNDRNTRPQITFLPKKYHTQPKLCAEKSGCLSTDTTNSTHTTPTLLLMQEFWLEKCGSCIALQTHVDALVGCSNTTERPVSGQGGHLVEISKAQISNLQTIDLGRISIAGLVWPHAKNEAHTVHHTFQRWVQQV